MAIFLMIFDKNGKAQFQATKPNTIRPGWPEVLSVSLDRPSVADVGPGSERGRSSVQAVQFSFAFPPDEYPEVLSFVVTAATRGTSDFGVTANVYAGNGGQPGDGKGPGWAAQYVFTGVSVSTFSISGSPDSKAMAHVAVLAERLAVTYRDPSGKKHGAGGNAE